jgi:uncharacterized YigZ family protein
MSAFSFRTIVEPSDGIFKESGSKFLAFAYPVQSEAEIKAKMEGVKKKYFDATHHCFAWMMGPNQERFRAFDDGEPNHSAGDPILGQIRSRKLTNILVVVVRYFGGKKLGVGGLIQAYKSAAEAALTQAVVMERYVERVYTLNYSYQQTPEIMKLLKNFEAKPLEQRYGEACELQVPIKLKEASEFEDQLKLLQALGQQIFFKVE